LEFAVFVAAGGLSLNIFLQNGSGNNFPHVIYQNLTPSQWSVISIPMSQLNPSNYTFNAVAIQNYTSSSQTFYLDNVRLVGQPVSGIPDESLPVSFDLGQNYPNPFNPETRIGYELPVNSIISLKIFNILGQEMITLFEGIEDAGRYTATWNSNNAFGRGVPSGLYFCRLTAADVNDPNAVHIFTRKLMLLK